MEPGSVDDCRACQQQQQLQGPDAARRESPPPLPVPGGESLDDEATEPSSSGLAEVGAHDNDLDDEEKAGPAGFNRSFLRCLVLLLPVSVPVVVYVRDADSTRRLFLFAFALFLVLIFSCITLAVVRSRGRGASSDDDEEAAPRAGRSSSRGLPFLRAMPYRVAQSRSGPHRNRYPGYRLAGQQLSPGARCPALQDDPPCYLDALKCPLAQTHQHKARDVETPPPAYEAVS